MRWPPPPDWPNAEASHQIYAAPHRWHVQIMGEGDTLLLLHGAGGSTHSFRDLLPALAAQYRVIAIDLPGQGFTQLGARHRCGLDAMAQDIAALCQQEGWSPCGLIGHSAGAAIALSLSDHPGFAGQTRPLVVGVNPALDDFDGLAGALFPLLAKLLASLPFTAHMFSALTAKDARVRALIESTGSKIDARGLDCYRFLVRSRDHVDATLLMMAQWSLEDLRRRLPDLMAPTFFVVGGNDKTVPPRVAAKAAERMPHATLETFDHLGHLAHEERPADVAALILTWLAAHLSPASDQRATE